MSSVEIAYINNFSNKNILCEREVSASGLSDPSLAFIKDIFKKRQWGKLIERAPTSYVEVVKEYGTDYESFNLNEHSITSTIRGQNL